jgi:hypothetical protein
MAIFTSFSDILPDPNNRINSAGAADTTGNAGPGFAKIKFNSTNQIQTSRTISGRGVSASAGFHMWEFNIDYNPITRAEFEPVASFLEIRRGRLYPFYVILPQHAAPQNTIFAAYARTNTITASTTAAGSSTLMINGASMIEAQVNNPSPGDFITITDAADDNHKKAYKITRVETNSTYQNGTVAPTSTQRRIHIIPPLVRAVTNGANVNFINPKFRVIQKGDTLEYSLDTDNLYQFSLSLEEIQP